LSLTEPTLADPITPSDAWRQAAARETPFGQYLGEKLLGGLEGMRPFSALEEATLPGRLHGDMATVIGAGTDEYGRQSPGMGRVGPDEGQPMMPKAEWEASPSYRPSLTWDEGMTPARADALATQHDRLAWNQSLIERYQGGWTGQAAGFVAGLAPGIADPTNYIPLLGPAAKAAMVARLGVIGGNIALHGAEAAANTALFEPLTASHAATFGQPYGWEDAAADIALGALAGSVGGAIHGGLEYRGSLREAATRMRLDTVMAAADATSLASEQLDRGLSADVAPVLAVRLPEAPRPATFDVGGIVPRRAGEAGAGISLDDMARARGLAENDTRISSVLNPVPYGELRDVVERDGAALADVQAHGIAGMKPEEQLDKLLTGGIDKGREFHTGPLGQAADANARAFGLGAKIDAPYVLLARPGERMKDGGIGAVVVNGEAKVNIDHLKARYPGVTFLAPDEIGAWARGEHPAVAAPQGGRMLPGDTGRGVAPSFATATPEPPHPSAAEAAKRVGKAADPLATFKQDAGLEGYQTPLPGHEPQPEGAREFKVEVKVDGKARPDLEQRIIDAGTAPPKTDRPPAAGARPGDNARDITPPTPAEKAATLAALPPELAEIEAMKREGSFTPGDEATLAAGEAEAQRAENYAAAWQTLAGCVARAVVA
jgi:hypothetical protein